MDTATVELAARNLSWMSGNVFLAWSAVFFALHLRGTDRHKRSAAFALCVLVPVLLTGRLGIRGALAEETLRSLLIVAVVTGLAVTWSRAARAGTGWARIVGYVGVIAFSPNAPYILTDCFHHIQDVRLVGTRPAASALLAVQYGWFLVVGASAWVSLLVIGRDWLRDHHPAVAPWKPLVPVGLVMAFGIYLGRIERFHSWHPLEDPLRFVGRVAYALTSEGPLLFTLVWWLAVVGVGLGGVRLHDRAQAAGSSTGALISALAWSLAGSLLAASPLIWRFYVALGVESPVPSRRAAMLCVLGGVALSAIAGAHLATVLGLNRAAERGAGSRFRVGVAPRWVLIACVALPLVGVALTAASSAQWWSQYRGLCEYVPSPAFDGDRCYS